MPLTSGSRLGGYDIVAPLGAGGMGEVYRARDAKLGRDVALKILPDSVAQDGDRVARFKREAQVLASLNHPHIAAIYGFDESDGTQFLVLELVEGETLADRLKRGPIPVDETIVIARQIAEALAEAHEKGIIHRDLKPANIALTGHDQVKVLDFGLAKLAATPAGGASSSVSMSPTLTTPAMMTGVGMILGTAAYMAPEQAKGREADKRCDVWAFGCVVYEMLTAKRAFDGEDITDTIASIMRGEPDWTALPADTPANLRLLLESCLTKDRSQRASDIAVVQFLLGDRATVGSTPATPYAASRTTTLSRALPWAIAGAVTLAAALVLWASRSPMAVAPRVTRTTIGTAGPASLTINGVDRDLTLSPDGTHVVYVGNNGTQIFVRTLDSLEPVAIATDPALRAPFVSPDGQWVGFFGTGNTLKKVAITGGPSIMVAVIDGGSRGATWVADDTIIFATNNGTTGLQRVSASGGTPEVLSRPNHAKGEDDYLWPEMLPSGSAVLFTIASQAGGLDAAQIAVHDLRTGADKVVLRGGSNGHYVGSGFAPAKATDREPGYMVYVAAATLRAIPFDLNRLATYGTAVPVLSRVATTDLGAGDFAVSTDGTLVYVDAPATVAARARTLVWVDRSGKEQPVDAPARAYLQPRLSPDGTRVALYISARGNNLWIWDLRRATLTRLTGDSQDQSPVWTPSGRIVFTANKGGQNNLWWQSADGTGASERLTTAPNPQFASGITPDSRALVFTEQTQTMASDLMQLTLDSTRGVTPLLRTKFNERNGVVSPDGRWLAYESDSSGAYEIYLRPFPNVDSGLWQVSTAGGGRVQWARNGKELFFVDLGGALWSAPVEATGPTPSVGRPTKLLDGHYFSGGGSPRNYDVSPDGQRFLMIKAPSTDAGVVAMVLVQHWDEELKHLVPVKH